ncbi:MAG: glutamyl-tRNA reductase [Gammaproteobacteria bacterium]|nr:MAG: glutamyl-tRNA reductase [Gammaproteobacteria bacterium]
MTLFSVGINHQSASIALREKVAILPEQMTEALQAVCRAAELSEAVILSTCNRTEIIGIADHAGAASRALEWLSASHHVPLAELQACSYHLADDACHRHLIAVASGLESMVLGEPQILGQMKSAFATAEEAQTIGRHFYRLFPHVFSTAKRIRTQTAIGQNPVSVAYAAVRLARRIYADLGKTSALLIGAGETIELAARHLAENGIKRIVVANRTLARAHELAERFGAEAVLLSDIPDQLVHADIVIASTASQLPILGKGAVERALKQRRHRPILMIDIAVPRDIEPEVAELRDVYLYTVDDLQDIIDENLRARQEEAKKADGLIDDSLLEYQRQLRSLDAVDTLRVYREQAEQQRDNELERALRALERGERPEAVMADLARTLTNKLIHAPSVGLRKAGERGELEQIAWLRQLLGLGQDHHDESGE